MTFAVVLFVFLLILGWAITAVLGGERKKLAALKTRVQDQYQPDVIHYGLGGGFIGFRFADESLVYGHHNWDVSVPVSALKAVEVRKDGVTITKTNRGSQLAGAAIGGLALGGLGALIGGLSGSSSSSERLKSVGLAFVIANRTHPFHEVIFGVWPGNGVAADSFMSSQALADMDRIRALALSELP